MRFRWYRLFSPWSTFLRTGSRVCGRNARRAPSWRSRRSGPWRWARRPLILAVKRRGRVPLKAYLSPGIQGFLLKGWGEKFIAGAVTRAVRSRLPWRLPWPNFIVAQIYNFLLRFSRLMFFEFWHRTEMYFIAFDYHHVIQYLYRYKSDMLFLW